MINLNVTDKDGDNNNVSINFNGDCVAVLRELATGIYAVLKQVSVKTGSDYDSIKLILKYSLSEYEEMCGDIPADDWLSDEPEGIDNLVNIQDYKK